jgi:hypothetical protein
MSETQTIEQKLAALELKVNSLAGESIELRKLRGERGPAGPQGVSGEDGHIAEAF